MEDKIIKLYEKIRDISAYYLIYQKRDNIEQTKKLITDIEEFAVWFLEENIFGRENTLYQNMCTNLLEVLHDILEALEQEDCVLLHDALVYGFGEYLEIFINEGQEGNGNGDI